MTKIVLIQSGEDLQEFCLEENTSRSYHKESRHGEGSLPRVTFLRLSWLFLVKLFPLMFTFTKVW